MSSKILIVDDEESIRWVLGTSLEKSGHKIDHSENGSDGIQKALSDKYDLIMLDIKMPGLSGLDVLEKIQSSGIKTPVILMTAQNTVSNAITGIKLGAYDYISKPFELDDVNKIVNKAIKNFSRAKKIKERKSSLKNNIPEINLGEIVGKSPQMLKIYKTVGRIADKNITILITGESGTGKELITKAIHNNSSRKTYNLVSINITAIPKELIESELFGHEKGAFTGAQNFKAGRFEEANKGTLHIDEIGEMSYDLQTKLLRVLEENTLYRLGSEKPIEIDVRIVTTTNKNLKEEVEKGNFREDLYYRLNAITIDLPPLRNRKDDISILIDYFTEKYCEETATERKIFSKDVIDLFTNYSWPGNVRELENIIKRIVVLIPDRVITVDHVRDETPQLILSGIVSDSVDQNIRDLLYKMLKGVDNSSLNIYSEVIHKVEKQLFEIILEITNGNKKKASTILGINRNTLAKKISELNLEQN